MFIVGQDGVDNNPAVQPFILIRQGLTFVWIHSYLERNKQRRKKPSIWSWMSKMLIIDVYCGSLKKLMDFSEIQP